MFVPPLEAKHARLLSFCDLKAMTDMYSHHSLSLPLFFQSPPIVLGFAFQTSLRWHLPFPVNIILLPVTILETFLSYYVAV